MAKKKKGKNKKGKKVEVAVRDKPVDQGLGLSDDEDLAQKSNSRPSMANAFGAFGDEDESSDIGAPSSANAFANAFGDEDDDDDSQPAPKPSFGAFGALEEEDEEEENETPPAPVKKGKKGKQKQQQPQDDEDDPFAEFENEKQKEEKPLTKAQKKRLRKKQEADAKAKAAQKGDDDDDIFGEFENEKPPEEKKLTKAQKKRQDKKRAAEAKKKAAQEKQDEDDTLFAELEIETKSQEDKPLTKAQQKRLRKKQAAEKAAAEKAEAEAPEEQTEEGAAKPEKPVKLSKAQKARLRKKEKAAQKAKEAANKKPKMSALAKKLAREREEKAREEAEIAAQKAAFEAEQKRLEEEAIERQKEKEKRAEERRKRREADRKKGKLLSAKQRAKLDKARAQAEEMRAQVMASKPKNDQKKHQQQKKRGGMNKREQLLQKAKEEAERLAVEKQKEDEEIARQMAETQEKEKGEDVKDDWEGLLDSDSDDTDEGPEGDEAPKKEKDEAGGEGGSWEDLLESSEEEESEEERLMKEQKKKAAADAKKRKEQEIRKRREEERKKQQKAAVENAEIESLRSAGVVGGPRKEGDLRSPICCILGHVDTGKTKILDHIRNTKVQDGEAGGITQQIGASFFPFSALKEQTKMLVESTKRDLDIKLPGLLVIDTPGHEAFTNLRTRGSNLCDIAILVVDIMHGLEQQTIESIGLLKQRKTPFVVALNKIDRLYDWKPNQDWPTRMTLKKQSFDAKQHFETQVKTTIGLFAEQGLNCALYWKNTDARKTISLVPTSALTGEGLPDLLLLLAQLTQKKLTKQLQFKSQLQCTVLEVKVIEGLGTTLDVILVNGTLKVGQTIVCCGLQGPIVTKIRGLLTPEPLKEMRVKADYIKHQEVRAAMGIKICAAGLDHALSGSELLVAKPKDDIEDLKDEVMQDLAAILSRIDHSGQGVCVQASTLGSLEALLGFLEDSKIPVSVINIGPVSKKDIMKAAAMKEKTSIFKGGSREEFACLLAFDVKINADAERLAESEGVTIFRADIIYHLFDMYTEYFAKIRKERANAAADTAIFPCTLQILPEHIYRIKEPIVMGVKITGGIVKNGSLLCVQKPLPDGTMNNVEIGRVVGIQHDEKDVDTAKKGQEVCLKIDSGGSKIYYGRQFDASDEIMSLLTRKSIDLLKDNFKDDLCDDDWRLVILLKRRFNIL